MFYKASPTVTKSVACAPSGPRHEIVKVVAPDNGTVAPPPESDVCEKLPSGDVSVQDTAFFDVQNTVVRVPSGTDAGTAQISACGGGYVIVEVATVVVATGFFTTFCVVLVCVKVTDGVACTTGWPTLYPLIVHRPSKKVAGIIIERKLEAHGLF